MVKNDVKKYKTRGKKKRMVGEGLFYTEWSGKASIIK